MKKFLSLVLALAMTMSLVTISAGAKDFTDADDITYVEAVDVMTAIGVVDGDAAGNFNPTAGLTRGAAAKIICNLVLGPTTASELNADTAPYKDVAVNSTFAGYIAYCQKAGIISGYADGTFKPAAPLTGYAFMKMLLGALGYDAAVEGYTGSNWSIQVAKRALGIDLNDGLVGDFNGSNYVTREEAMLYAFNTLTADMVDYDTTITVGDVTIAGSKANETGDTFMEKYFKNLDLDEGHDVFGRPSNTWTWKNEEIGEYAVAADNVWTAKVTQKALYNAAGSNAVDNFTWKVYVNGEAVNYTAASASAAASWSKYSVSKTNTDAIKTGSVESGNGVITELYVNSDTKTVNLVVYTQYVGEITRIKTVADDDDTVTMSLVGVSGAKKFDIEDASDFAKEDIVVVTMANGEVQTMVAAEVVKGSVSGYKADEYAKMDGTTYKYNKFGHYDLDASKATQGNPAADSDATLYLDPYGYVMAYEATETVNDYLYLVDWTSSLGDYTGKVLLADGTTEIVTLSKLNDEDIDSTNKLTSNVPYSYTVSDGKYKLTSLTVGTKDGQYTTASGKVITRGTATFDGLVADKNTVFVDKKDDAAYTGYNAVPSFNGVTYFAIFNDSKVAEIVFITDRTTGTNDAEGYFFVKDVKAFDYDKSGDDETWTFTVYGVDGEETTMVASDKSVLKAIQASGIGLYEIKASDSDGYMTTVNCLLALDLTKVGASVESYATVAGNGTIKTTDSASNNLWNTTSANTAFTGTYVYDDDTDFITVVEKAGNKIDTVTAGGVNDISTYEAGDAENTAVYVVTVDDDTDKTPLAELVIVVVPYVD